MLSEPTAQAPGKRRRENDKYDRILDAAMAIFAQKGFHEAKISEIAREAGVADGTIYLYFKNKDDLLCSLFETKLEAINEGLRNELNKVNGALAKIERFIRYHLEMAQQSPTLAAFITIEIRRSSKFIKEYGKAPLTEYLDQLRHAIELGKGEGVLRSEISTGVLTHTVFGALDQACIVWITNPNRQIEDLSEVGAQIIDFVFRAARAPGAAQQEAR